MDWKRRAALFWRNTVNLSQFFTERCGPDSYPAASSPRPNVLHSLLPDEIRKTASLGWKIFPVTPLAKLMGTPNSLIDEATSEIADLEEASARHDPCGWRIATGPLSLFILRLDGSDGRRSFQALTGDCEECPTLWAHRGDIAWAYFRWPAGMVIRAWSKKLALGLTFLAAGDSCPIPPSEGCTWINPGAEPEALPYALRELAFETPDRTPGKAVNVPAFSPPLSTCRARAGFDKHQGSTRTGYPIRGHVGGRGNFRISRRR